VNLHLHVSSPDFRSTRCDLQSSEDRGFGKFVLFDTMVRKNGIGWRSGNWREWLSGGSPPNVVANYFATGLKVAGSRL
jgi:hypothetical protein